ncbi:hypothetical protein IQ249_14425 [Lusitaniella coriacea LEGE 07157]|uniref:Uncharacterized protein n=1 Tax=Lusitaniella coriacea LEGE 07157 TaxID=945747 RepID=A0A8J7J3R0_9CYAN|nr:glycosyltransferase family 39 protein [Lusitaniella coriacea]MBE9117094.1 hypothetical protein [Lusitaniella coriacea LEGE 07157]
MHNSLFWRLLLSTWFVNLFHFRHLAAGSDRFIILVMSLVEQGKIQLDTYYNSPFYKDYLGDVLIYQGHAYSNINPGLSFLAVPAWGAVNFFYQQIPLSSSLRQENVHYFLAHFVSFAFTTGLLGALTACLLGLFIYRRTQDRWRAILGSLLYSFGSIAFFFSTRLNQNIPIAFIGFCVFILIFDPKTLKIERDSIKLFLIGFLLGLGIIIDVTIMPFLGVALLFLLWQYRKSILSLNYFILGVAFPILAQGLYHYLAFGNPFLSPSIILAQQSTNSQATNPVTLGLKTFNLKSILEYLFSYKTGLFIYMPYSLLSVWYMVRFWRNERRLIEFEKRAIALIFLSYLLFIAIIPSTYLYPLFGPRYILPIVPFICLLFALYLRQQELQLGIILAALGFLINIGGTQLGNDTGNVFLTVATYLVKGPWLPALDWLKVELPEITGYSPEFMSPYGLFFLLFICLLAIWIPYFLNRTQFSLPKRISGSRGEGEE